MMNKCLNCGSTNVDSRNVIYMCNPTKIIVPCSYLLCNDHKDLRYDFHDIYDENSKRKNIDHSKVIERLKDSE